MFGSISYLVVLQKDWHLFLCTEDCKAFSLFVLHMFLLIYLQWFKSLKKKKKKKVFPNPNPNTGEQRADVLKHVDLT